MYLILFSIPTGQSYYKYNPLYSHSSKALSSSLSFYNGWKFALRLLQAPPTPLRHGLRLRPILPVRRPPKVRHRSQGLWRQQCQQNAAGSAFSEATTYRHVYVDWYMRLSLRYFFGMLSRNCLFIREQMQ